MIYKYKKTNKEECLKTKRGNNYLAINELNELRKNINILALITIGIGVMLITPSVLYCIDIIPVTVPFYPLVMSALAGGCLGLIAAIPTVVGNIGITIMKVFLNLSNKKIEKELEQISNIKTKNTAKEVKKDNNHTSKLKKPEPKNNTFNYQHNYNYTPNFILCNNPTNIKNNNNKRKILKK